jgi:tetratricopeptide (TPR) repeat protein
MSLNNLAGVLHTRFGQTGRIEDVDEAIALHREALGLLPAPHPNRSNSLHNLAEVFLTKYNTLQQSPDLERALDAFDASVAYEYAPARRRFRHAKSWIRVAHLSQRPAKAYQAAIALLPRIITLDLDLRSRQVLMVLLVMLPLLPFDLVNMAKQSHSLKKADQSFGPRHYSFEPL